MDDWELLHGSDTESTDSITMSSSVIDDDGMIILSHHFSADNNNNKPTDLSRSETLNELEVLVDLGFDDDRLNVNQSGDAFVSNELGIYDSKSGTFGDGEVIIRLSDSEDSNEKKNIKSESVAELTGGNVVPNYEDASNCLSETEDLDVERSQSCSEEPIDDSSKSCSDSVVSGDSGVLNEGNGGDTVEVVVPANSGDEGRSRREIVWWKMPFVLLKYSVFRIGPVWSVSMAAAVMGLVLLGRRLYNMKKKAQSFHLKVTIDDKKVSRVMSQAARLNEAFTEVRRVPVIRPALPSPGAWPVLSLR